MNKKKITIIVIIVSIILAVVAITSSTYALFYNEKVASNKNEYSTGLLSIEATSKTNTISLDNAIPMEDSEGVETKPYIFTITNKGNLDYTFNVRLLSTSNNTINANYIKLKIDDASVTTLSSLTNSTIKSNLTLKAKESVDIEIRVWLASNTPNTEIGKSFTSNLVIDGQAVYTEPSRDDEIYTVTFDPNGGSLGTQASTKQVVYGSTYGNLPTPTRTGYTFKGWNGKNMFDKDVAEGEIDNTQAAATSKRLFTINTYVMGLAVNNYFNLKNVGDEIAINGNTITFWGKSGYGVGYAIKAIPNQVFRLSYNTSNIDEYVSILYYESDGTFITWHTNRFDDDKSNVIKTSVPSNAYYMVICLASNAAGTYQYSDVQLEEGTVATEYEPYYITNDTRVVQNKNHTLTAIWEKATPTVTLDANGGTIPSGNDWTGSGSSATKQVTYDSTYGNLPTPTRTGYTFKGWNGKNLINETKSSFGHFLNSDGDIGNQSDWAYSEYIEIVPGKTYTFNPNSILGSGAFHYTYDDNKNILKRYNSGLATITMSSNTKYIRVSYRTSNSYNIQLEEGAEATAHEPYYIQSDTTVVQDKNHTLTAIWEQN